MNDIPALVRALAAGLFLGGVFFGGLWWTVRRGLSSDRPFLWFSGSLLVRSAIAIAGFVWVARRDGWRLLACLVGFFLARLVVTHFARQPRGRPARAITGDGP
jgi:F1F0 ATPase subunit 2